jgi:hypothetical protein
MKILLIQPPWFGFQNIISLRPYLGLAYIAAILEKDGHQVCIFNGETFFKGIKNEGEHFAINEAAYLKNFTHEHHVYKDIMTAAKEFCPDIVGISFVTANSSSAYILSKLFKTYNPGLPLIAEVEKKEGFLAGFRHNARKRISENYSWEKIVAQYFQLFENMFE